MISTSDIVKGNSFGKWFYIKPKENGSGQLYCIDGK